jgi:hypothetical protein
MCFGVLLVAREGAKLAGHFGRGGVGHAGHDRGERTADGAAFLRSHRECRTSSAGRRYWRSRGPGCGTRRTVRAISLDGNCAIITEISSTMVHSRTACSKRQRRTWTWPVEEGEQVQRGQVAGRVVQEHVFRARVGGADLAGRRAGVPVVDGGVNWMPGSARGPGGMADLLPQLAGLQASWQSPCRPCAGRSGPSRRRSRQRLQELVGDAHRVVGVLARNREVGFRIPVGVVGVELDLGVALRANWSTRLM